MGRIDEGKALETNGHELREGRPRKVKEFIPGICCFGRIVCQDEAYGRRIELWV